VKKGTFITALAFLAALTVVIFAPSGVLAADPETCANCHDWAEKPDSEVTKFVLPMIADGSPSGSTVDKSKCQACHQIDIAPKHQTGVYLSVQKVNGVVYGAFLNQNSLYKSPSYLHSIHNAASTKVTGPTCLKCHGVASCSSCHDPVPHDKHYIANPVNPLTGDSIITPVLNVSTGRTRFENGTVYPTWNLATTCAASECHQRLPAPLRKKTNGDDLCYNCHQTAGLSGHDPVRLDQAHIAETDILRTSTGKYVVACDGCHSTSLSAEHRKVAVAKQLSENTECGYCHGNSVQPAIASAVTGIKTANSGVTDSEIMADNRACTECHFNVSVMPERPLEHLTYHKADLSDGLSVTGGPHNDCNTCHANTDLYVTMYDLAAKPVTERSYDCFVCHKESSGLAPLHSADFFGDSGSITDNHQGCGVCHTPGTPEAEMVSEIIEQLEDGSQGYSCTNCHSGEALDEGHPGIIDANCTKTCHNSILTIEHLENPVTQSGNLEDPLTCGTCHNSGDIDVKLAITTGNGDCTACHNEAHNMNFIQQIPSDIVLYPGYEWSVPQSASIWSGDPWMPDEYEGARLVISNRRQVSYQEVWDYYRQEMAVNGWTLPSVELAVDSFTAEFKKGNRKATVFFYGGENHQTSPVLTQGYRIEILYK